MACVQVCPGEGVLGRGVWEVQCVPGFLFPNSSPTGTLKQYGDIYKKYAGLSEGSGEVSGEE